jgi:hypothetical protein
MAQHGQGRLELEGKQPDASRAAPHAAEGPHRSLKLSDDVQPLSGMDTAACGTATQPWAIEGKQNRPRALAAVRCEAQFVAVRESRGLRDRPGHPADVHAVAGFEVVTAG